MNNYEKVSKKIGKDSHQDQKTRLNFRIKNLLNQKNMFKTLLAIIYRLQEVKTKKSPMV